MSGKNMEGLNIDIAIASDPKKTHLRIKALLTLILLVALSFSAISRFLSSTNISNIDWYAAVTGNS